jgi:hypothetical protein
MGAAGTSDSFIVCIDQPDISGKVISIDEPTTLNGLYDQAR